jgi:hypothetical protein
MVEMYTVLLSRVHMWHDKLALRDSPSLLCRTSNSLELRAGRDSGIKTNYRLLAARDLPTNGCHVLDNYCFVFAARTQYINIALSNTRCIPCHLPALLNPHPGRRNDSCTNQFRDILFGCVLS